MGSNVYVKRNSLLSLAQNLFESRELFCRNVKDTENWADDNNRVENTFYKLWQCFTFKCITGIFNVVHPSTQSNWKRNRCLF